jgi:mono/diheme cytochrome c family protein
MRLWLTVISAAAISSTAAAQQVADPQKGHALALKDCDPCHGVAKGETRSPNPNAPRSRRNRNRPWRAARSPARLPN